MSERKRVAERKSKCFDGGVGGVFNSLLNSATVFKCHFKSCPLLLKHTVPCIL